MDTKLILLCMFGFLAQFIDSIAGGGGLISIPALMAFGISPHFALGTNKFGAMFGTVSSTIGFVKSKKVHIPMLKYLVPCAAIGAALGVNTVLMINQKYLNGLVLILLFTVSIYTIFKKDMGDEDRFSGMNRRNIVIGCIIAFTLGFYDGFFGPGTGSFLIFSFITFLGFDFLYSCGNAKVLNTVSAITSFIVFAINDKIIYSVGIPFAISMILGAIVGTKMAIQNGKRLIKPIFILISVSFIIKLSLNIIG
ncbi:MAG: TSUP family transporter [Bacillota bacterium]